MQLSVVALAFFALGFVLGGLADEPPPDPAAEQRVTRVETKAKELRDRIDQGGDR